MRSTGNLSNDLINTISRRLVLQLISGETPSDVASVGFSLINFTNRAYINNIIIIIIKAFT